MMDLVALLKLYKANRVIHSCLVLVLAMVLLAVDIIDSDTEVGMKLA